MLRATKGNRVRSTSQAKPARVAPQGALIFDNWTKRRTASHDTGRKKPFGARVLERFQPDAPPISTTEITETALRARKGVGERIPFGTTQPPPCRRRRFRAFSGQKQNKKGKRKMKNIDIDWNELAKAVIKAVWPFIAGAVNSPVP